MKKLKKVLLFVLLPALFIIMAAFIMENKQDGSSSGYPRPITFREVNPQLLQFYDHIRLLVSDMHTHKRMFSDEEFKKRYPERPVLIQINNESTGLWGSWEMFPVQKLDELGWTDPEIIRSNEMLDIFNHEIYPMFDYPGHWVYEAGSEVLNVIPEKKRIITIRVNDIIPFLPLEHHLSKRAAASYPEIKDALMKDVVIYGKNEEGTPDWINADMGSIMRVNEEKREITVRRWRTSKKWGEFSENAYVAPNAVSVTYVNKAVLNSFPEHLQERMKQTVIMKPFMPNLTPGCPVDPRTGLNAAETMAKHFIEVKQRNYPLSDGFVFDVSCGTFMPSHRVSDRVDADNDGRVDNFLFDSRNHWPLGIYDVFRLMREGKRGHFKGLGDSLLLMSDSNYNEDQRFFNLVNGGEFEHSFTLSHSSYPYMYSSNLDRFLLWENKGRKPNLTFIHNKYPDETKHGGNKNDLVLPMTLAHFRRDMATACMGPGYVGKVVGRTYGPGELADYPGKKMEQKKYGGSLPTIYDEYDLGKKQFGWLGLPVEPAKRLEPSPGDIVYRISEKSPLPAPKYISPWKVSEPERSKGGFSTEVLSAGLWRSSSDNFKASVIVPLPDVKLKKDEEYTLTFTLKGSSAWEMVGKQYQSIPKNLRLRFVMKKGGNSIDQGSLEKLDTNVAQLMDVGEINTIYMQEILVFPEERNITLTLFAPGNGEGFLEMGMTEAPGSYIIENLVIRKGCADKLVREFEHGLVLVNGSPFSSADFDLEALYPGKRFRRIEGIQDPKHNNGEVVKNIKLNKGDGIFLIKTN